MATRRAQQLLTMLQVACTGTLLHGFQPFPPSATWLQRSDPSHQFAFTTYETMGRLGDRTTTHTLTASRRSENDVRVSDLLSDLPTPALLIELSLAESAVNASSSSQPSSIDEYMNDIRSNFDTLDGSVFVHTRVTDTSFRDQVNQEFGSGKSTVIAQVDAAPTWIPGGGYLGIGLANHHVGGYYWARGMGMGASLAAHGIAFGAAGSREMPTESQQIAGGRHDSNGHEPLMATKIDVGRDDNSSISGELYWKKRGPGLNAQETTEESSNSNDGKRSEWADFVVMGDTVQLVPYNASRVLTESPFQRLFGVRRLGRPLGADPIVERIWERSSAPLTQEGACWVSK